MLAPFTAGWQTTDLHPLIIDKSEVYIFPLVYFLSPFLSLTFGIVASYERELKLNPLLGSAAQWSGVSPWGSFIFPLSI